MKRRSSGLSAATAAVTRSSPPSATSVAAPPSAAASAPPSTGPSGLSANPLTLSTAPTRPSVASGTMRAITTLTTTFSEGVESVMNTSGGIGHHIPKGSAVAASAVPKTVTTASVILPGGGSLPMRPDSGAPHRLLPRGCRPMRLQRRGGAAPSPGRRRAWRPRT